MDKSKLLPQKPSFPKIKFCDPTNLNPIKTDTAPSRPEPYIVIVPASKQEQLEIVQNIGVFDESFPKKEAFIYAIAELGSNYSICFLDPQESLVPSKGGSFFFTNPDGKHKVDAPVCAIFTYDASNGRKRDLFEKFPVKIRALAAYHETPAHYIPIEAAWTVGAHSVSDACNLALGQCAQYLKLI